MAKAKEETEEKKTEEIEKSSKSKAKKEQEILLVPLDYYVKASIHIGTKVITKDMSKYVYRRRADGLAILNTKEIDKRIKLAAEFLSNYEPNQIILACKREAGWIAAEKFFQATGIRVFTKKYPAGIITNIALKKFFEPSLVMVADPWLDKNPMKDAIIINVPIVALCDTNNLTSGIDLVVPCNNKSNKSLGLVLWILAREYLKAIGKKEEAEKIPPVEEFIGEKLE